MLTWVQLLSATISWIWLVYYNFDSFNKAGWHYHIPKDRIRSILSLFSKSRMGQNVYVYDCIFTLGHVLQLLVLLEDCMSDYNPSHAKSLLLSDSRQLAEEMADENNSQASKLFHISPPFFFCNHITFSLHFVFLSASMTIYFFPLVALAVLPLSVSEWNQIQIQQISWKKNLVFVEQYGHFPCMLPLFWSFLLAANVTVFFSSSRNHLMSFSDWNLTNCKNLHEAMSVFVVHISSVTCWWQ